MSDVTQWLSAIEAGDSQAAHQLLPLVYDELRNLAGKELHESRIAMAVPSEELIAVNDALETLALEDPQAAEVVRMRYCVGMTVPETADARPPVPVRLPIVSKA